MLESDSGIDPEVIAARGYWSVEDPRELEELGFRGSQNRVPGLMIPIHGPSGEVTVHSYRPDQPRMRKGKPVKYEWPAGESPRLDVPPAVRAILGDPAVALWFTEGSKKADAAVSRGLMCLALIGVWNWRGKNAQGGSTSIGDFEHVALKGRTVYIAFDSDVTAKPSVRGALERLTGFLKSRGAKVVIVTIPSPTGDKVGLDDYLATGGTVEELISGASGLPPAEGKPSKTAASQLIGLIKEHVVELWHDRRGVGYASFPVEEHVEHAPIMSDCFGSFCDQLLYKTNGRVASAQIRKEALGVLVAQARFEGNEHHVALRIGHTEGKVYLYLADKLSHVIEIAAAGYRVVPSTDCPVRFIRQPHALSLPLPERGGDVKALRDFMHVDDESFELIVGCVIGWFLPEGTFPIGIGSGEQGSGKSFGCRLLRRIVDPVECPVRLMPRDPAALGAAARNNFLLAFDNLSSMPLWLADALCGCASGTGLTGRELFTNSGEHLVPAQQPVLLNGIDDLLGRGDLADRAIVFRFLRIEPSKRRLEAQLLREFDRALPGILGAFLNRIVRTLANKDLPPLEEYPRLADLAQFVTASEDEGTRGSFVRALFRNRAAQHEEAAEADSFIASLRRFLDGCGDLEATATDVLGKLNRQEGFEIGDKVPVGWPRSARSAGGALRRAAPVLRNLGYTLDELPRQGRRRGWRLAANLARDGKDLEPSSSSPSSSTPPAATYESSPGVTMEGAINLGPSHNESPNVKVTVGHCDGHDDPGEEGVV